MVNIEGQNKLVYQVFVFGATTKQSSERDLLMCCLETLHPRDVFPQRLLRNWRKHTGQTNAVVMGRGWLNSRGNDL